MAKESDSCLVRIRIPYLIARLGIGVALQQQPHRSLMPVSGGPEERCGDTLTQQQKAKKVSAMQHVQE